MRILAIDPGVEKCGLAVLESPQIILERRIVLTSALLMLFQQWMEKWNPEQILLGDATHSKAVRQIIQPFLNGKSLILVDEHDSTYRARKLYFRYHPPKGFWRFIPLGLQVPPEPYDDFAAAWMAFRHLSK